MSPDPRVSEVEETLRHGLQDIRRRRRGHRGARRGLALVLGPAGLVLLGTLLLALPASGSTRALAWNEAFFTAVSALTVTGLSIITPGHDLSLFGQVVLLGLMQLGGVGFMVAAVVVFRLLGRRVTLEERMDLRDSLGLVSVGSILRITWVVLGGVLLIEGLGALVLWGLWSDDYGPGPALYYAVWHSVSAFCNASFDLFSGSPDAPAGFPRDSGTLLTLSALVVLGSLGIPVLADLQAWPRRRRLSLHSRLTVATAATLLALGLAGLLAGALSRPDNPLADEPGERLLVTAFFLSAASRTSGFMLEPMDHLDPGSVLLMSGLMFVGGSPASMGGGVTTSTLAVLVLATLSYIRGARSVTAWRRTLPPETVQKAVAITVLAATLVGTVAWLLAVTQRASMGEALFESVSAFSTCGFTLGLTPRLDLFGQVLVAATMFAGRLGVLTTVVVLSRARGQSLLRYPEERILIG